MKRKSRGRSEAARLARRARRTSDVAAWGVDVDVALSHGSRVDSSEIERLPLPLVEDRVFAFLAPPPLLEHPATMRDGIDTRQYEAQLGWMRAVCRSWNRTTQRLLHECEKRVHKIRFHSADMEERTRILRAAKAEGTNVQQLEIVMGSPAGISWSFLVSKYFQDDVLTDATWWRELFACYPQVTRLDLSCVDLKSITTVLRAASTKCPRMRGLVVRGGSPLFGQRPSQDETAQLNRALVDALRNWHSTNGGLRLLTMPCWVRYNDEAHAEVIAAIASFCPSIEYLPTWSYAGIVRSNQARPHQVPLDVWSTFCQSCTALRSVSWNLCEFSPDHVQQFVSTRKPSLCALEIELQVHEWQNSRQFVLIQSVLASVPTLRSLSFSLTDVCGRHGVHEEGEPVVGCSLDDMVQSIPRHCPRLESFCCQVSCEGDPVSVQGDTVDALVRLPSLRRLRIYRCKLNANSIVGILDALTTGSCVVELATVDIPHTAIANALAFLSQQPASRFANMTLSVSIRSDFGSKEVDRSALKRFPTRESVELLVSIRDQHAQAKCAVSVDTRALQFRGNHVQVLRGLVLAMNVRRETHEEEEEEADAGAEQPAPLRRSARLVAGDNLK